VSRARRPVEHNQPVSGLAASIGTAARPVSDRPLEGKRVAMVVFSHYKTDTRPRGEAEALVAAGMCVDLVCPQVGSEAKREVFNGVSIRRVPVAHRRGGSIAYLYQYSTFLLMAAAIFAFRSVRRRYDLVYVHNMPDFLVLSGLIPKLLGAKVILDLHDPMPELMMTISGLPAESRNVRFLKQVEKWSIRLADRVVTVNDACAKLFAARSCSSNKIQVVMNSPDEEIFRFRPSPADAEGRLSKPFVIMYHGSLVERNGLNLAVDALERVVHTIPNAQLRIYGARNHFLDSVMDSVKARGLDKAVLCLGSKSLEEIVEAIKHCDVGIVPNERSIFTEINTPVRIFEYLALGKPVIAPRSAGICDYFNNESLIFFDLGSVEDLAQKIQYVFAHPLEVQDIVGRGKEVHQAHTWRKEKLKLIGLVAELLQS
jgi:glycosyltransferase involved in cell wall biosynthesis